MKMKMAEDLKETFVDVFNWLQKHDGIPDGHGDCRVYPITNWQNELKGAVIGKLFAGKDEVEGICLTFDKNDISVINGKFTTGDDEFTTKDMIIIVLRDEDDKIETLYILGRNEKDRNFVVEV